MWRIDDPQANEADKCKYEIVQYTRGQGLDIGCGPFKIWPSAIGVDSGHHWGTSGVDLVRDASDLEIIGDCSVPFVFSSHLLEHVEDPTATLREWWRVIRGGGHLVLYLPHKDHYPRMGTEGANPDHKSDFAPNDITKMMASTLR